jgi:hypothetical protein
VGGANVRDGAAAGRRRAALAGDLAGVLGVVVAGTGVATICDALVRPVDGNPAVYFLLLLALPLWDRLPARVGPRIGVIAGSWIAIAAFWYVLALRGDAWWRGAGAFGVATLMVGWAAVLASTAHARAATLPRR